MNLFLKIVVTGLIFFTPFSFAGVEAWAFTVLQGLLLLTVFVFFFPVLEFCTGNPGVNLPNYYAILCINC